MGQGLSRRDAAGNGAFGRDVGARRFGIRGPVSTHFLLAFGFLRVFVPSW
jgi:hypothetical protein